MTFIIHFKDGHVYATFPDAEYIESFQVHHRRVER